MRGRRIVCSVCFAALAALVSLRAQTSPQPPLDQATSPQQPPDQPPSPVPPRDGAPHREPAPPRPRDPRIVCLASDASSLPPEFAADTLIRIASSARVADDVWKGALLNEAYFDAYKVREVYRRSTPESIPIDTRQGADLFASSMSLNRVSLQVRVAQLMAFIDPRRARELFEWIDFDLTPGRCEEPLVPAVDEYYSALSLLARTTFAGNRDEALRFFVLYLWRAHLPSEISAVVRAMIRFDPRPTEALYFESVFDAILHTGTADPRGFSASVSDIVSRTADFQIFESKSGLRGIHLMEGLREYLVSQLKGPRCADSPFASMAPSSFNAVLRRVKLADDVKPIDAPIAPERVLETARIDQFWQTDEARDLRVRLLQLRGTGREPVSLRVRETAEWAYHAEQLLAAIDQWTARSEASERDGLAQKSMLYLGLLELVPPSKLRTLAFRSVVDYLRHADRNPEDRSLWFAFVNRLLELSRGNDRDDVLAALDNAHHPVLAVYAQLERIVPIGQR